METLAVETVMEEAPEAGTHSDIQEEILSTKNQAKVEVLSIK